MPIAGLSQSMSKPESMKAELRCILGGHDLTDSNRACPIAKGCLGQDAKAAKIPGPQEKITQVKLDEGLRNALQHPTES